jgi:hypothetical protein
MTKEIGNSGLIDTWAATGSKTEPADDKKNSGYAAGERPAAQQFNWLLNDLGKKVNHILKNGIPDWNVGTEYDENDFVSYGGFIWRAVNENTGDEPPSSSWESIAGLPALGSADTVLQVNAGGDGLEYGKVAFANVDAGAVANETEAQAGTATDKLMTPQRTAQAISALTPPGVGRLLAEVYLTSTGDFTKADYPGIAKIKVCLQAAGGGGGGASSGGNEVAGGGGAAGEYREIWINVGDLGTTETVTLGAVGAGGNTSGTSGGSTSANYGYGGEGGDSFLGRGGRGGWQAARDSLSQAATAGTLGAGGGAGGVVSSTMAGADGGAAICRIEVYS